jgi:hypothetical protein
MRRISIDGGVVVGDMAGVGAVIGDNGITSDSSGVIAGDTTTIVSSSGKRVRRIGKVSMQGTADDAAVAAGGDGGTVSGSGDVRKWGIVWNFWNGLRIGVISTVLLLSGGLFVAKKFNINMPLISQFLKAGDGGVLSGRVDSLEGKLSAVNEELILQRTSRLILESQLEEIISLLKSQSQVKQPMADDVKGGGH